MGFIRQVHLNPTRAKLSLTVKFLFIFSILVTGMLFLFNPAQMLVVKSIWLFPLVVIIRLLYILSGPGVASFYIFKALGYKGLMKYVFFPLLIGAIALILWINILIIKRLDPQTVLIPVILWLIAGGWATYIMLTFGK